MIEARDLKGAMVMMPAFATDDATEMTATSTVDVGRLRVGVDRMVRDGADVIATTGSFGECYGLSLAEFETLAREVITIVGNRIPVAIGVTSTNPRETLEKTAIAQSLGADAVLVGAPYYFPLTVANGVRFFRSIADAFPKLGVVIYHNPPLHRITLPTQAFEELIKSANIIGMKDSHRDPISFVHLQNVVGNRISTFVAQFQYFAYHGLGAAGVWSIDAWMGPWPILALRDAVRRGDLDAARAITAEITPPRSGEPNLTWRETAMKVGIRMAGYVDPGPLRPPFFEIPDEIVNAQRRRVEQWQALCRKYAPASAPA
jgi:4-(2-carboxyphenyl)-2-oxobut-3-enoate aldolase